MSADMLALSFNVLDGMLFPVAAFFRSIFKSSLIISFLSIAWNENKFDLNPIFDK